MMDVEMVVRMWDVTLPAGTELYRRFSDTIADCGKMEPADNTNFLSFPAHSMY